MPEVRLGVNGRLYYGWKSIRVTRSIESISGSFELEVSDRWAGQGVPWPIREEDACKVEIDGHQVIGGHVEKRRRSISEASRSLVYGGRDASAGLVDGGLLPAIYRNVTIADVLRRFCEPLAIPVSVQSGLTLPKVKKVAVAPAESAFSVIDRLSRHAGVLVVSDGLGGLMITRSGQERSPTSLVLGDNILGIDADSDAVERFYRYVVLAQSAGTDNAYGAAAAQIKAEAIDHGVRREERMHVILPEQGMTAAEAQARADWEARVRAARAEAVTIPVPGWLQPDGRPWQLNVLIHVEAPAADVSGDHLLVQVDHLLSEQSAQSQLRLMRPDAFTPEPQSGVKARQGVIE